LSFIFKKKKDQLKNFKINNNSLKQEFEDYKLKATKTLATKEKLILSLKEAAAGKTDNDTDFSDNDFKSSKLIELEELKLERDMLREELNEKLSAIEMLRSEMAEIEMQNSIEIENLKNEINTMEEREEKQKHTNSYLEQDMKSMRQQLDYAQEELYKNKAQLNGRIQEREAEIEKLRNQLTTKNLGTTTEKELENRLHLLTENLIQKQTLIEALQSDKHSIFLQLERSEKRLEDYENILSKRNTTILHINEDDHNTALSASSNAYFKERPFDHEMTKKVKRAASEIDKTSIRIGVFLKKYPIARIFVIFYMILLHLWVAIVLFTYRPEIHSDEYHNNLRNPMPKLPNN
jgi:chromosome segregation ATPase